MDFNQRWCIVLLSILFMPMNLVAQEKPQKNTVYNVNLKWELPTSIGLLGASYFGFREMDKYASYTEKDLYGLNPNDINAFDRPVVFYDPAGYDHGQQVSDMFLNICVASPLLLGLDSKARKDWAALATMFVTTHTVNNALYFTGVRSVRRARPLTYNTAYDISLRTGEARSNSFFSGHVSTSAASTFFAAKVLTDYHGIKGWKRLLVYTAAAIPPSLVGYYRMRAGKHFRTDVMVGLVVGAATGILVPELHRKKNSNSKFSLSPFYYNNYSGFALTYKM
ncbi:MAG: phosphatase PAP2 family protein [Flavipsychrobacter sp.]